MVGRGLFPLGARPHYLSGINRLDSFRNGCVFLRCKRTSQKVRINGLYSPKYTQIITHTIHVWYIYLHLPYKSTKCRQIYHTWILWVSRWKKTISTLLDLKLPSQGHPKPLVFFFQIHGETLRFQLDPDMEFLGRSGYCFLCCCCLMFLFSQRPF